jgi:hypothetical protein
VRIAYLVPVPELNGGNKVIFQHAGLLARAGHRVTVLGAGPEPDWMRLEVPYLDYLAAPPGLPPQDLVIATFWTTIAEAGRLALGPIAHFCQGYEGGLPHNRPVVEAIEAAYALPLPTLTVSRHLARLLAERFGRASRLVRPVLDPAFRPAPRWRPRRRPWVALGGIFESEVKGIEVGLEAVRRLRERGLPVRLLRFSSAPLGADERRLLAPDLYLCGARPEEVARRLARCDLLLMPSRAGEGFGLPLLEAMASKVPAVASRIPSTAGFASRGAVLVPADDPQAMAAAAAQLLGDARGWREARRRGFRETRRFAPERVAPRLDAAVRWAVGRAPAPEALAEPAVAGC